MRLWRRQSCRLSEYARLPGGHQVHTLILIQNDRILIPEMVPTVPPHRVDILQAGCATGFAQLWSDRFCGFQALEEGQNPSEASQAWQTFLWDNVTASHKSLDGHGTHQHCPPHQSRRGRAFLSISVATALTSVDYACLSAKSEIRHSRLAQIAHLVLHCNYFAIVRANRNQGSAGKIAFICR